MYAIPVEGNVRLTRNEALRGYARLEYTEDSLHWLLASAPRRRKAALKLPWFRLFTRPAKAAARPVACKGVPRMKPEDVATPG